MELRFRIADLECDATSIRAEWQDASTGTWRPATLTTVSAAAQDWPDVFPTA